MFFLFSFLFSSHLLFSQNVGAEWLIKPVLTGVDEFRLPQLGQSVFAAKKADKWGALDVNNRVIVPFKYASVNVGNSGWIGANAPEGNAWYTANGVHIDELYDEIKTDWSGIGFVRKGDKWGVIDAETGNLVAPIEYAKPKYDMYKGYFLTKENGEVWASGKLQQKISPAQAEYLEKHARSEWPGVRVFERQGQYGFTTLDGDTLSPAIYRLQSFHPKGYAVVSKEKGKWLVINQKNETVLDLPYEKTFDLTPDLCLPVKQNDKWGIIQIPDGKIVISPDTYDNLYPYGRNFPGIFIVQKEGKRGLINDKGDVLIPLEYSDIQGFQGVAALVIRDKKLGIYGEGGRPIIEPKYRRIENRSDSLCTVLVDSLWTILDIKTGAELFPPRFNSLEKTGPYFVGGNGADKNNMQYTLLDRSGKELLPITESRYQAFSDGTLWVENKDGSAVHRTLAGKTLRQFAPKTARVEQGIYIAVQKPDTKEWQYFLATDAPGREVWLQEINKTEEDLRLIKKDKLYGYADHAGKIIIQPAFEQANKSDQGYMKVKYKGKWGVLINPVYKRPY